MKLSGFGRARNAFGAALVAVISGAALAGCSSGDGADAGDGDGAASSSAQDGSGADGAGSGIGSNTELAGKLVTTDDLTSLSPAGKTEALPDETIQTYVKGREQIKDQASLFGQPCDDILHADTVVDGLLSDAVITQVTSGDSKITVALRPGKLEPFLDQSAYAGCQGAQIRSEDFPEEEGKDPFLVTLGISTDGISPVDGGEGFRETRDIVRSNESGETTLNRNVSLHGYAGDTSIEISYAAVGNDVNADPTKPGDGDRAQAILAAQVAKLQK
ncbi:hypothetical protein [Dietzia sp.]|uniref:hypothetical protein n=1 Tax=Dietzia sp. TaxID=1871616 RepID=UPI002FD8E9B6